MRKWIKNILDTIRSIKYIDLRQSITIDGYKFKKTCPYHPEQYDVVKDGKMHGYVRLRRGHLTCEYPDVFDTTIYDKTIGKSGVRGYFYTAKERMYYLNEIRDTIRKHEEKIK